MFDQFWNHFAEALGWQSLKNIDPKTTSEKKVVKKSCECVQDDPAPLEGGGLYKWLEERFATLWTLPSCLGARWQILNHTDL